MDVDEIFVEIDDKKEIDSDITKHNNNIIYNDEKPHHGNSITMIEISPNGSYLVTYSKKDRSIVGWNVDYENEGSLKPEINHYHIIHYYNNVNINISVSNDKKIAYIYDNRLTIIDMNNNQEIKLNFTSDVIIAAGGDFLRQKIIWIYSTQTKNNKWECKKIYKLPSNFELISISKYDQVYLFSNSYIYLWNISTVKSIKIFINKKTIEDEINKHIEISSNEKFMCLRIKDKIIIYSIELEIPIVTLNNGTQLYNFINNVDYTFLYLLLLPLLSNEIRDLTMKYYWKEYSQKNDLLQNENQSKNIPIHPFLFDIKYAFGILNGYVWKFKLEETILKMNSSLNESNNEIIEGLDDDSKKINKEPYEHLNIHLFDSYMDAIRVIFLEVISEYDQKNVAKGKKEDKKNLIKEEIIKGSIKWEIENPTGELKLQVFNKINDNNKWNLICTRTDKSTSLYGIKLLNSNNILLLTEIGVSIYHFNGKPGFSFEKSMNNDDPNNPWNLAPTYSKVLDDGTTDSNPYIIQQPDENTNMFIDYRTALFAMYLFLTGDSSALSNWSYLKNPPLAILTFSFSLLIVVYLMNLFIGLLNNAIEKDNNRVSYLMQKAEVLYY
ncbi:hypothetical protein RhiirA4_529172 [Rhizophagus irregularis]|uniref:Ion transport domain-containing protein n=1 Tax=Rhizophagus irregularis TaxID=588596 RepID=A0A2I1GTV3_9GLOM|nr:hypothetical protein RhiirA4_529172 [Rhizophagus irregularis]